MSCGTKRQEPVVQKSGLFWDNHGGDEKGFVMGNYRILKPIFTISLYHIIRNIASKNNKIE